MVSNSAICIIGGYDELSKSLFKILRNKYKSTIFINLLSTIHHNKNLYNYNIFELKKILELLKTRNINDIADMIISLMEMELKSPNQTTTKH